MNFTKTDFYIAGFIGFFTGVFLIPTLAHVDIRNYALLLALPLVFPIVIAGGIWLGDFLARWFGFFRQVARFSAVGILNTAIDFGILNILSLTTGITHGLIIGGVNTPGFVVAVINSYFLNKLWVFKGGDRDHLLYDFPKFLAVTLVGLAINSGIVIVGTTYISPLMGASPSVWLNIVKFFATFFSLLWNFLGFKYFVFKK